MIPREKLKSLLQSPELGRIQKLTLIQFAAEKKALRVGEITALGTSLGLRDVEKWNISDMLRKSRGLTVLTAEGWELTREGLNEAIRVAGIKSSMIVAHESAGSLRESLTSIPSADTRKFVEEAIEAYENLLYRSAVVLSWVGAMSSLHQYVFDHRLAEFNAEAMRRYKDKGWRDAKSTDDIGRITEFEFLETICALGIVGNPTKQALQKQLQLRNNCGHPNTFDLGPHTVASHIEILILNVFTRF